MFRHFDEHYVDRVRAYRETEPYHRALRKRKVWVEPLFAEAKDWHGMRKFRLRQLERVNIEALMIAAGQNVKRLLEFGGRGPRKVAWVAALSSLGAGRSRGRSTIVTWSSRAFLNRLVEFKRYDKRQYSLH